MSPLKQLTNVSPGSTLLPGSIEKAAAAQTYRNLAGTTTLPASNNLAESTPVNAGTPATPSLANAGLNMQVNPGAIPTDPNQMNPASPVAQKKGIIKKTIEKVKYRVKKNIAEKKASKEAYDAAKEKGGGIFDMR